MPALRAAKSASTTAAEGRRPLDSIGCICKLVDDDDDIAAAPLVRLFSSGELSYTVSSPVALEEASLMQKMPREVSMTNPQTLKQDVNQVIYLHAFLIGHLLLTDHSPSSCHIHKAHA